MSNCAILWCCKTNTDDGRLRGQHRISMSYVSFAAILRVAVENPYQRLALGTSAYRTSAFNCWVTLRVT